MMPDMMDNMMSGGGFGWLWMFVPLLFWGSLLALVAWVLLKIFPGRRGSESPISSEDSAEEILGRRFARGEIDTDEYERSLEVLRRESNTTKGGV